MLKVQTVIKSINKFQKKTENKNSDSCKNWFQNIWTVQLPFRSSPVITTLIPDASQTAQHHILNNQVPLFSVFSLFFHGSVFDHCAEIKQKTSKTDKIRQKQTETTFCYACNTEQRHENELCSRITESCTSTTSLEVWIQYFVIRSELSWRVSPQKHPDWFLLITV